MAKLKGERLTVTLIEVEEEFKKIVLSTSRAEQYKQLQYIQLGALMWGEVRRIEEFGAFIGLDGTRISGLLHISNISRSRVETVDVSLEVLCAKQDFRNTVLCSPELVEISCFRGLTVPQGVQASPVNSLCADIASSRQHAVSSM